MKRHFFFLFVLMALTMSGQGYLTPSVNSPDITKDGTVTFRVKAANADTVRLIIDSRLDTLMKHTGNETWSITLRGLEPDLYMYYYIVDGMKVIDNENAHTLRDVKSVMNTFVLDPQGDCPVAVHNVPHGEVRAVWYDSPTLGAKRRMMIYLPPGYEESRQRYPVFYLLHGSGGDETVWLEQGRAAQVLDNLIASGKAVPMIVVMPNGNVDEQAASNMSALGNVQPTFAHKNWMDGTFEQSFSDIMNWVDKNYRTRTGKRYHAIAGLSMGGFHALYISANNPSEYGYVGLFSAAISSRSDSECDLYKDIEQKLKQQFRQRVSLYWIGIGKDDFLREDNQRFTDMLDRNRLRYTFYESDGGHEWRNWRLYLTQFVPLLFK